MCGDGSATVSQQFVACEDGHFRIKQYVSTATCTVEVINIKTQLRYEVKMLEALNPAEAAQGRGPQPKQQLGSFIPFCPKVFEASETLLVRTSLKGGEAHWFRAFVILLLLSLGSLLD